MIVFVDLPGKTCSLADASVFTAFHVEAASTDTSEVVRAMGVRGRECEDAGHLWVSLAWLIDAGPKDDAWRAGFERMIAYARSRGWTDLEGTHIKAHLKQSGS